MSSVLLDAGFMNLSLLVSFTLPLKEVDPCEDLTDDDIRTAIQNATGPRSALFVPDVGLSPYPVGASFIYQYFPHT